MRVKTGETATASLSLVLGYQCSFCQEENLSEQTLTSSAHTGTIMGVNLNNNISSNAQQGLIAKLTRLQDKDDPTRFNDANFSCYCRKCGRREPWAQMTYKVTNFFSTFALVVLVVVAVIIFAFINNRAINEIPVALILTAAASALTFIGLKIYKKIDQKAKVEKIRQLPLSAIPTVNLYDYRAGKVIPIRNIKE